MRNVVCIPVVVMERDRHDGFEICSGLRWWDLLGALDMKSGVKAKSRIKVGLGSLAKIK